MCFQSREANGDQWDLSALNHHFRLVTAPLNFTTPIKRFKALAASLWFRNNQYLDDWLNRYQSFVEASRSIVELLNLLIFHGCLPNMKKSQLVSTQNFVFLGDEYDLVKASSLRYSQGLKLIRAGFFARVSLSKQSLHLQVFKDLCRAMWTPIIDLFDIAFNVKVPLYVGPVPDPQAF